MNIVAAREVLLTCKHVALVMELAAGGSMTDHVAKKWQHGPGDKLFMSEDESRYYFRVRLNHLSREASACVIVDIHVWEAF